MQPFFLLSNIKYKKFGLLTSSFRLDTNTTELIAGDELIDGNLRAAPERFSPGILDGPINGIAVLGKTEKKTSVLFKIAATAKISFK